jgi:hypothetical protein
MVKRMGYKTRTTEAKFIMEVVFIIQFLFTGPLLILLYARTNEDFTMDWYKEVGRIIIYAMIINAFAPILEFILFFTLRSLKRCWSDRCKRSKYFSRAKHI